MMVTNADLAQLRIRRLIFHDVPNNPKGGSHQTTLSATETDIDVPRRSMLRDRLIQVLGSKSAYPVRFSPTTASPLPKEVQTFTYGTPTKELFIEMSRRLAGYLFDQQSGAMSSGLLCVVDVETAGRPGIAILKLEREQGAELEFDTAKRTFSMSVLDNLVLTEGTKLFKSALFIRSGTSSTDFRCVACDSQRTVVTSEDVARFWLRFLGVVVLEEPRVSTHRWYEATIRFINEAINDPVTKNTVYEHLTSELNSNKPRISPHHFSRDFIPDELRAHYRQFLKENNISPSDFAKDTKDIQSRLRRRALHTVKGVVVTVPSEEGDGSLVAIEPEQIIVHDQLQSVEHK